MVERDEFRKFAFDCEMPIRSARALVIAIRHMTDSNNPEEVVVDAIGHLANDACTYLDRVLALHEVALKAGRS